MAQQSRNELEQEKQRLQREIEQIQKLLRETQSQKKASVSQVAALQNKIEKREKLIGNINGEINIFTSDIERKRKSIDSLNKELKVLKKNYAKLVVQAYKTRGKQNELIFLFSAQSVNEAFKRYKYLKSIAAYRLEQAEYIAKYKDYLRGKITDLEDVKRMKEERLEAERQQKETLENEKKEKDSSLTALKQEEKNLKRDLDEKKRARERLNAAINEAIRREIDNARKNASTTVTVKENNDSKGSSNSNNSVLSATPESLALSNSFAQNKGDLPWPVENGVITGYYGEHAHPTIRGVKVKNNGVDIKTYPNSSVRAVFEGTVVSTLNNPVFKNAVIIRHGSYFTVYTNLENITVKTGDKVNTKERIGTVYYNAKDDKTEVHFEIWQGTDKLNPANWIRR